MKQTDKQDAIRNLAIPVIIGVAVIVFIYKFIPKN